MDRKFAIIVPKDFGASDPSIPNFQDVPFRDVNGNQGRINIAKNQVIIHDAIGNTGTHKIGLVDWSWTGKVITHLGQTKIPAINCLVHRFHCYIPITNTGKKRIKKEAREIKDWLDKISKAKFKESAEELLKKVNGEDLDSRFKLSLILIAMYVLATKGIEIQGSEGEAQMQIAAEKGHKEAMYYVSNGLPFIIR